MRKKSNFFKINDSIIPDNTYLNLFYPRPLEPQVKTVVGQAADLLTVSVITHTDDWNFSVFYQSNKFLLRMQQQLSKDILKSSTYIGIIFIG